MLETLLVSAAGAVGGLLLADTALDLLATTLSTATGMDLGLRLDWRVGAFTLAATVLASALAGLAPVRHALRLDVLEILKSEEGTARTKRRLQRLLVAGQTAASVVFFGLALLFMMSYRHAAALWPGFDPGKSMVVIPVAPSFPVSRPLWLEQASERLRALPGVKAVTFARRMPLSPSGGGMRVQVTAPGQAPLAAGVNMVGPDYFPVMGLRLLAGRGIGSDDRENAPRVAVISRMLARKFFGVRNPVGETLSVEGQPWEIVGVVEDAPSNDLHEKLEPFVYLPASQMMRGDLTLLVETAVAPVGLIRPLLQELKRFDPGGVTSGVTTLQQHMDRALFPDRTAAITASGLGILGFLLTAAGLFGLVQFSVSRRTRELGLRMALGATPDAIQHAVLGESLRIIGPGVGLGLLLLGGAAQLVRSELLNVSSLDPAAYAACALTALIVSLAAAWLPARRATQIDPVIAMRTE